MKFQPIKIMKSSPRYLEDGVYTNTHVRESGFQVELEPVAEEYIILVQLLK